MVEADQPPRLPGTVIPSPHPDYLHALLLQDAHPNGVFHSHATQRPHDDSKSRIRYLSCWKIDSIVKTSLEAQPRCDDGDIAASHEDATTRAQKLIDIQSAVVSEYTNMKSMFGTWLEGDAAEKDKRRNDIRDLIPIDADHIRESGGLVMRSYWRNLLGWKESELISLRNKAKKSKYFFETPVDISSPDANARRKQEQRKFVWDFELGKWIRAPNCMLTKAKRQSDRANILSKKITEIKEKRDAALRQCGLGFMTNVGSDGNISYHSKQADDTTKENTSHPEPEASPSTIVQPMPTPVHPSTKRKISSDMIDNNPRKRRQPARKPRTLRALPQTKKSGIGNTKNRRIE